MEVMLKHINEPLPELPEGVGGGYRRELEGLLSWILEKKADKRPQSCREVKQRLRGIFTGISSVSAMSGAENLLPVADSMKTQDDPATLKTGLSPSVAGQSRFGQGMGVAIGAAVGLAVVLAWLAQPSVEDAPAPTPADSTAQTSPGPVSPETESPEAGKSATKRAKAARADKKKLAAPAVKRLPLRIESEPPGAVIRDNRGVKLGTTPWSTTRPGGELSISLNLEGYEQQTLLVDSSKQPEWNVALVAIPKTAPEGGVQEPSAAPQQAPRPSSSASRSSSQPKKKSKPKKAYPTF